MRKTCNTTSSTPCMPEDVEALVMGDGRDGACVAKRAAI